MPSPAEPEIAESRRAAVESIFSAVVNAVEPRRLSREAIRSDGDRVSLGGRSIRLGPQGRLVVIAVGKASLPMVHGAFDELGDRIDSAIAVTKHGFAQGVQVPDVVRVYEADHPVPGPASVLAGQAVLDLVSGLRAEDVVLMLISGGGSALIEAPVDGVRLDDIADVTTRMLDAGATINELNAVRRHLSRIKGGRLAEEIAPATVANLILSDVLGSPLPVIASGPTVHPDESGVHVNSWLNRLRGGVGISKGLERALAESMSARPPDVSNVATSVLLADASTAARAAADRARALGFEPVILGEDFEGEAREFARFWCAIARHAAGEQGTFRRPACLIGAGEMTVTLHGDGVGGRNTEMALAAAIALDEIDGVTVASLATDGDDGLSGATGGVVDGGSAAKMREHGVDPVAMLERNDSAPALDRVGALLRTGPTGTNVNDIYFALID